MRIDQVLFSQGFGSRSECAGLLQRGLVQVASRTVTDAAEDFETEGLVFKVSGQDWPFRARALVMLHKPAGYECSQQPRHHPSVMGLLPQPLRRRGVQPVGRLDEDTTGLLLLTDDGPLIHRLTSPKHHVPKLYQVRARYPVDAEQCRRLCAGVVLNDDPRPVCAVAAQQIGECTLELTLLQGRYHQVKRMMAAVGNRCEVLHRSRFGRLELPATLAPGQWAWADAADL